MSSDDDSKSSKTSVVWALGGNSMVMLIKFLAWALTLSSAMLAEALHSLGDVINQIALLLGIVQGSKKPDKKHPFGYGRARYLLNCIAAGLVALLAGITLIKGSGPIFDGHVPDYILNSRILFQVPLVGVDFSNIPFSVSLFQWRFAVTPLVITFAVLGLSLSIEGYTLWVARQVVWRQKGKSSLINYIRETSDPTGVAVFLEDFVAELGVATAILGIVVTKYFTSNPVFDGIAALVIAVMMLGIAVVLLYINGILLLGRSHTVIEERIRSLLLDLPFVESVHRVHTQIIGSGVVSATIWVEFKEEAIYEHVKNGASQELIGKSPREIVEITYKHTAGLLDGLRSHINAHLPDVLYICVEAEIPRERNDKDSGGIPAASDLARIYTQTV